MRGNGQPIGEGELQAHGGAYPPMTMTEGSGRW
jgi:hypothetical protein